MAARIPLRRVAGGGASQRSSLHARFAFGEPSCLLRIQSNTTLSAQHVIRPYRRPLHSTATRYQETPRSHPGTAPLPLEGDVAPRPRRSFRPLIWATSFFLLGVLGGSFVKAVIIPPPIPAVDSPEDEFMLAKIRKDIGNLPLVQELRSRRDEWLEYEAYMAMSPEAMDTHMTAGTLKGCGGLGVQRVFWNKKEQRIISVVFFGGALSGWPGVTHGGIIGTVLQENLERVANGPDFVQTSQEGGGLKLENLNTRYLKPTGANALYVVRAEVEQPEDGGAANPTRVSAKATLEDALNGTRTASATGFCSTGASIVTEAAKQEAGSLWQSVTSILG
jgi:hypothetical protein